MSLLKIQPPILRAPPPLPPRPPTGSCAIKLPTPGRLSTHSWKTIIVSNALIKTLEALADFNSTMQAVIKHAIMNAGYARTCFLLRLRWKMYRILNPMSEIVVNSCVDGISYNFLGGAVAGSGLVEDINRGVNYYASAIGFSCVSAILDFIMRRVKRLASYDSSSLANDSMSKRANAVNWLRANAAKVESTALPIAASAPKAFGSETPVKDNNQLFGKPANPFASSTPSFGAPLGPGSVFSSTPTFRASLGSGSLFNNTAPFSFGLQSSSISGNQSQSSVTLNQDAAVDVDGDLEQLSSPSVKKPEEKGVKCKLYVKGQLISHTQQIQQVYDTVEQINFNIGLLEATSDGMVNSVFYISAWTSDYIHYYLCNEFESHTGVENMYMAELRKVVAMVQYCCRVRDIELVIAKWPQKVVGHRFHHTETMVNAISGVTLFGLAPTAMCCPVNFLVWT